MGRDRHDPSRRVRPERRVRVVRVVRAVLAVLVAVGSLGRAGLARAACPVAVVPTPAPPAWALAIRDASAWLTTQAVSDCSALELAIREDGRARMTFVTTEGRRAVRDLASPEELPSTLAALLVTSSPVAPARDGVPPVAAGPAPPAAGSAGPAPPAAGSAGPAPPAAGSASVAAPAAASSGPSRARPGEVTPVGLPVRVRLGASAGARLGLGGAYLAPALSLRPAATFGPWELAVATEWAPATTYLPGGVSPDVSLWSLVAGVQVGRRQELGHVALGYGLGLGVAALRETTSVAGATEKVADYAQPRVSTFGRLAGPSTWRVRPTLDLLVDAALGSLKQKATAEAGLPELPRWGVVLAFGAEIATP